jgi:REP element-mobilizing transposase RayT
MEQRLPHSADLRKHRFDAANRIYFVTKRVAQGSSIDLAMPDVAPLIIEPLFWLVENRRIWLLGFVVMPDHLHLVLAPRPPQLLREVMQLFCSFTARQINAHLSHQGSLWSEEYYEHLLASREKVQPCLDYIYLNPVRRNLATQVADWPYSSLRPEYHDRMSWRWLQGLET